MRSWKGILDFLKAAHLLKDQKDIKFIIIGGGHFEKYLKFAKDLNLENVIFTGHLEDPYSAIGSLDIFMLLSTDHEGVSQALLQAAFLKRPLITTPIGGNLEVCIDKKTGFVVPTFSPKEIVKAINILKKDKNLREFFGKKAKERILKKFTYDKMLDDMEKVYHIVL
jgi:glycosyltransferase involved in cell wall biosynthesis